MDITHPARCELCLKRPRAEGGLGNCPQPDFVQAKNALRGTFNCTAFKAGDRKLKLSRKEREQGPQPEGLF